MEKRAISEFRWTSVEDIVRGGGYLGMVEIDRYQQWFEQLDPEFQERVVAAWGEPPGEEREGVPAAMVHQKKIVITGISLGNAVVCTQPKRGCAGSRCDGTVCRILHDPEVPPPHHYLATYRYLQEEFGADAIVHVGTHGTLEFLPGKAIALSPRCAPDAVIGNLPHLYLYNSDNPPEGTIAKRRAYATLIDHLQTVMEGGSLYGELKELEDRIAEYRKVMASDRTRAHALEHIILDLIRKSGISSEVQLEDRMKRGEQLEMILEEVHRVLARLYSTQLPQGMHVFGRNPTGEKQALFITSMLRYHGEIRSLMRSLMGLEMEISSAELALLRVLDEASLAWVTEVLQGTDPVTAAERVLGDHFRTRDEQGCAKVGEKVNRIAQLLDSSDELGSLLHALEGKYVEPGPSGLITRGKMEILPTGRNLYSLDPSSVPTEAAWMVGKRLAQALLDKYRSEHEGSYPENVGMLWMASDIMWADGEQLAQMLYLLGVEPVWGGGRVGSFRVIPLSLLGRPRIDVTVRASAILRDCFASCMDLLDDAIRTVAEREEPDEANFVRKHVREQGETIRIFSSRPGTYGMGVNLAVYASAWKEVKDLSEIFVTWNGYGYGRDRLGAPAQEALLAQLKTVQVTFNKTVTDEYDLLGCCCYFGSHGGLTAAARTVSGKPVAPYYGDTRDANRVDVRTLGEEITRVVRSKLLHPRWIEGLKEHGYSGASEIARRIGRVYGWEATTEEVEDHLFDDIARTFLLDQEMRRFFEEHNPWALEEAGRRLLEAHARGLWNADPEVLEGVREAYLEIEGWMEESLHEGQGIIQGGAIDIIPLTKTEGLERVRER
jgi:cobaltochelatase CobN